MKKSLFAVLAILTLLTGCSKTENTNTLDTTKFLESLL